MMLLKRLLPAHDHEALLGDLHEERRRGRSLLWYGSQILAALVVGSWRDVRKHPILAMRGIATGLLALTAYFAIVMAIPLTSIVMDTGPGTRTMPLMQIAWIVGSLFASIPGGVLLGGILGARTAGPRAKTSP